MSPKLCTLAFSRAGRGSRWPPDELRASVSVTATTLQFADNTTVATEVVTPFDGRTEVRRIQGRALTGMCGDRPATYLVISRDQELVHFRYYADAEAPSASAAGDAVCASDTYEAL